VSAYPTVTPEDVRHVHVCGDKDHYCGHPRQYGIENFGGGELVVVHAHATWDYHKAYPRHGFDGGGYKTRSVLLLRRSTDGGETWPDENKVVIFDETASVRERKAFLFQDSPERDDIDLSHPDSMVIVNRTWLGERDDNGRQKIISYAHRSADRGHTWENAVTLLHAPGKRPYNSMTGHRSLVMPDGSSVLAMLIQPPGCVAVYGSDDNGLTWEFLSEVARSETGLGGFCYPGMIRLPDGRFQFYMLDMMTRTHAICVSESDDLYAWTRPRPIVRWGASPWIRGRKPGDHSRDGQFPTGVHYRSPWPLLLADGRILVVFARRKPPCGIGGIVSADEGKTWSGEFIIRRDASGPDLGYPVATQLEDGRVFTAYYYMLDDGNPGGGTRHIAGSSFSI